MLCFLLRNDQSLVHTLFTSASLFGIPESTEQVFKETSVDIVPQIVSHNNNTKPGYRLLNFVVTCWAFKICHDFLQENVGIAVQM
jgi:hypothetical protein